MAILYTVLLLLNEKVIHYMKGDVTNVCVHAVCVQNSFSNGFFQ